MCLIATFLSLSMKPYLPSNAKKKLEKKIDIKSKLGSYVVIMNDSNHGVDLDVIDPT